MPMAPKIRATWDISVGVPTRMAPCRSAVTRAMEPSRSASAPCCVTKSALTSCDTSSSVV